MTGTSVVVPVGHPVASMASSCLPRPDLLCGPVAPTTHYLSPGVLS
jgi:hypothetical protein